MAHLSAQNFYRPLLQQHRGLTGYQLGGTLDHDIEQLLGINGRARITLGYAIGHPGNASS